ncbi:DUF6136 family protein [Rheinheimera sp. MMS21-TC3]|uniref:DUF6136 family protein n=1 Tax=Rheinheimera sp. MMS21-TC3 TaxID=3072790 RepID=UPI0028C3D89A|nr:DUF6136 family protein [Rheinheimera sp. MMS21-TC3]WNO60762.1 DUF6136 family protein [Rheinheimera sp. MMS21-TC3]
MISRYISYRFELFRFEIKHWLAQLSGLSLFLVGILGSAIPVVFYLTLLGFGMLFENKLTINEAIFFAATVLLFQTVCLGLCKAAITGQRFIAFTLSLTDKAWLAKLTDILLASLCNPLLLLHIILIGSVNIKYWLNFPHMFLLLLLQILFSIMAFISAKQLYVVLALLFVAAQTELIPSIEVGLLIPLLLLALFQLMPKISLMFKSQLRHKVTAYSAYNFWLDFWRQHSRIPLLVLAVTGISLLISHIFVQQRPDLAPFVFLFCGQLLVLVVSALPLELSRQIQNNQHFYALFAIFPAFNLIKNLFLVVAGLLVFLFFAFISASLGMALVHFSMLLGCFYIIKTRSNYLIFAWLFSFVFVVGISSL